METTRVKFNIRSFVALMAGMSALGLPVTGIACHYYGFEPMTVARHAWMSAHNILGFIFAVSALWHAALNRRAIGGYIRNVAAKTPRISREAALAAVTVVCLTLLITSHAFHAGAH
jgi:hypothetical protein